MTTNVHAQLKGHIQQGHFGTMTPVRCTLRFSNFVPKQSLDARDSINIMSKKINDLIMEGPHASLNPIMDHLIDISEKSKSESKKLSLLEAIEIYVNQFHTKESYEGDSENDVLILRVDVDMIMLNCLPFMDQESIMIEKATVQTPLFRYDVKQEKDET